MQEGRTVPSRPGRLTALIMLLGVLPAVGLVCGAALGKAAWDRGVSTDVLTILGLVAVLFGFGAEIATGLAYRRGAWGRIWHFVPELATAGLGLGLLSSAFFASSQPPRALVDELLANQSLVIENRDGQAYVLHLSDDQGVDRGWFAIPARGTVTISNLPGPMGRTYSVLLASTSCQIQALTSLTVGTLGGGGITSLEISGATFTVRESDGANLTPAGAAEIAPACVASPLPAS